MQTIELSTEEAAVLRDVLTHTISEMDVEVFRTDTHNFKEMLKRRRETLERILSRLEKPVPVM